MGIQPLKFRRYRVYELRYTLFPVNFRLMAAIFDLQYTQTSESIPSSLSVLPYYGNMSIAVGIVFLTSYHVKKARYEYFRFGGHHLGVPTFC